MLTAPMFPARWRWNLNRSLTVLRMRGGRKNPPAIQRMEADDLMAAVFPVLAACQENVAPGPMEIPDHPLVRQTLDDCLHEAMDIDGLRELVAGIEAGRIAVITRDTTEPSVLAHEILNGPPFTYLDDETEAGNRRSRAVHAPPRAAGGGPRPGPARPGRDRAGQGRRSGRSRGTPTSCTTC